jgi:thiamine kinase-like enzyme
LKEDPRREEEDEIIDQLENSLIESRQREEELQSKFDAAERKIESLEEQLQKSYKTLTSYKKVANELKATVYNGFCFFNDSNRNNWR